MPRASSEFMRDFWQSPPAFSSMPSWILRSTFARDCQSKMIENSLENRFRRVPRASRIAPGGLRDSTQHTSVISAQICDLKGPTRDIEFSHFWPQSGARPDPENHSKIDFLRKKGRQGRYFCRFLPCVPFFSILPSISARF